MTATGAAYRLSICRRRAALLRAESEVTLVERRAKTNNRLIAYPLGDTYAKGGNKTVLSVDRLGQSFTQKRNANDTQTQVLEQI